MTSAPTDPRAARERTAVDRCPGVLRPHRAADGALLRLRVPGGRLPASSLDIISQAAANFGDGDVQLTSRANLQLRAVATAASGAVEAALVDEVLRAGLLPHPSHERVRNIICSPLSGLSGGLADLRPLISDLDEKLCSAGDLAELPGPFLFVLDDGRGDLDAISADLRVRAVDDHSVQILVGDAAIGPVVPLVAAADVLISLARAFLPYVEHSDRPVWHIRELPQQGMELYTRLTVGLSPTLIRRRAATAARRLGLLAQDDGRVTASTLVPLGLLDRSQVTALTAAASVGGGQVIVTPWRGVMVPGLPFSEAGRAAEWLAVAGLELDDRSPWQGVTACTGAPRCAHGEGETRSLAGRIVRERPGGGALPVHVVGCERRCGSPSGPHVEALASSGSVEIASDRGRTVVPVGDAPAAVWAAR